MQAAFLIEPGRIEVKDVPVPEPSKGEALVKIRSALTCGTDLKAYMRGHPMIPMPGVFGHEFSGVIAETGKGVKGFSQGDEVMAVHSAPCLNCIYCRKKLFNLCDRIMETKVLGAFGEYVLLPSSVVRQNLFLKPRGLSFEDAAFLEPLSCVVYGMSNLNIGRNDRVLIIGSGPIGLLHLLLIRHKGAKVMMAGRSLERLLLAKKLGADVVASGREVGAVIDEFTDGLGADYAFECTGQIAVWEDSVSLVRRGGTVILFGGCKNGTKVTFDTYRLHYDEITLRGSFHFRPEDVKEAYYLLKQRKVRPLELISGTYALSDIVKAFEELKQGRGLKYVINP